MLSYILRRVKAQAGINALELNPEQRAFLLDYINEAASELWESTDLPGSLQEVFVNATPRGRISLPAFVGKLRAVRHCKHNGFIKLVDIRSRYVGQDWVEKWNKFRVISTGPLANEITNAAPLQYRYPEANSDVSVTVHGSTESSNNASETITMTSAVMNGTVNFVEIRSISKEEPSEYNLSIVDVNGNDLSLIYADQRIPEYITIDISAYPNWQSCCAGGEYAIEVLYKQKLPLFLNDTDEFPVADYDDIIVLKTKQLLAEEQEGQEERAALMYAKAKDKTIKKTLDSENTFSGKMTVEPNRLFGLFGSRPTRGFRRHRI